MVNKQKKNARSSARFMLYQILPPARPAALTVQIALVSMRYHNPARPLHALDHAVRCIQSCGPPPGQAWPCTLENNSI